MTPATARVGGLTLSRVLGWVFTPAALLIGLGVWAYSDLGHLRRELAGLKDQATGQVDRVTLARSFVDQVSTAQGWHGGEARILRFVFWASVILGCAVGVLAMLQAYVWPFTLTVPLG